MKISDLLRNLADTLDAEQQPAQQPEDTQVDGEQPDDLFVPPLQLKMELLKKATGVDSIFDGDEEEVTDQHQYPDQLSHIRRNAGLCSPAVLALSDDEPLDV